MPVPILTLNHDGVKLRTILRHPRWVLHGLGLPLSVEVEAQALSHPLFFSGELS